jgi:transketolase
VIRPADANETAQAWRVAIEQAEGPVCLLLTRQDVPVLDPGLVQDGVARGGYVLRDSAASPDVVLVATGSEVSVALTAQDQLSGDGLGVRVVSMPSWELFDGQDDRYRESVLPRAVPAVSIEAGVAQGWSRYVDAIVSIERFGASAPGAEVMAHLGITPAGVSAVARRLLRNRPVRV